MATMPANGEASGSLSLISSGSMAPEDIRKFHPKIQGQLDDIVKQGWKYSCVDAVGTAIGRIKVENTHYWLGAPPGFMRKSAAGQEAGVRPPEFAVVVYLGLTPPEVEGVPEAREFKVNISSKSCPQAASADLVRGIVTYLHDSFWKWEKDWEADAKKLSDAKEVYEIATWLVDVKKFKLADAYKPERYQELKETFEQIRPPKS